MRRRLAGMSPALLVAAALFLGFLALYVRTAAPSVLSGDSAEFQLAAPLLGVPHPTTYPLYILLGKLATLVGTAHDPARRVTLVSAGCAALAVALFFDLARRLVAGGPAAVAALLLGVAPGLWNAATLAEVYALLMLLLVALCWLLATEAYGQAEAGARDPPSPWRLRGAAFVAGLGFTHHGLFVLAGLPLLLGAVVALVARAAPAKRASSGVERWSPVHPRSNAKVREGVGTRSNHSRFFAFLRGSGFWSDALVTQLGPLALCFVAGMTPWLYPLIQYARYGPFNGIDYGLPRHYFWGAPESWRAVLDLMTGGAIRRGIFRAPSPDAIIGTLRLIGGRLPFEFGALGALAGLIGCAALWRRNRAAWLGSAWIFLSILAYLLLLGPAVEDAPVFTLPMLLPWALWIAAGLAALGDALRARRPDPRLGALALALLLIAALAWGYTRLPYADKRSLWMFRSFGEATLAQLPPESVVIAHWEQGTTLQYLVLVERRADVFVDIDEPGDVAWDERARRYPDRPVFFLGSPADVAGLPVERARADPYADLFQLRR